MLIFFANVGIQFPMAKIHTSQIGYSIGCTMAQGVGHKVSIHVIQHLRPSFIRARYVVLDIKGVCKTTQLRIFLCGKMYGRL